MEKFNSMKLESKKLHEHYKQAMSAAQKKIVDRWEQQGNDIQLELIFPNNKPKANAYSVDILLPDYLTLVEIDGPFHDNMVARDNIRDKHILSIAHNTGYNWQFKRIPFEIPKDLLYGTLQGSQRELVKSNYNAWLNNFADTHLSIIKNEFKLRQLKLNI
jgi:very-short-patch-repair endonuclease